MTKTLDNFAAAVLRVRKLLAETSEAQWQPGKTPTPREDTTERAKGMVSDPTPSAVADPRRLKLRIAVLTAQARLEKAGRQLQIAEDELTEALTDWQG